MHINCEEEQKKKQKGDNAFKIFFFIPFSNVYIEPEKRAVFGKSYAPNRIN